MSEKKVKHKRKTGAIIFTFLIAMLSTIKFAYCTMGRFLQAFCKELKGAAIL